MTSDRQPEAVSDRASLASSENAAARVDLSLAAAALSAESSLLAGLKPAVDLPKLRYRPVFTPVGWQVIDTHRSRDPLGQFGHGAAEYREAADFAARLNIEGGESA